METLKKKLRLNVVNRLTNHQMAKLRGGGVECSSNGSCGGDYNLLTTNSLKDMREKNKPQLPQQQL